MFRGRRVPWWVWVVPAVVAVILTITASLRPQYFCWDGEDALGRPTGGCEVESYRLAVAGNELAWFIGVIIAIACTVLAIRSFRRSRR